MPFYIFAWIALLAYAAEVVLMKLTTKYAIANSWLFNFLWNVILAILIFPVAHVNRLGLPHQWGNIILAAVTADIFTVGYVSSMYKMDVSVLSPLFNLRTIFAVILGVVMLKEIILGWQLLCIIIIIAAGIFVNYEEKFTIKSFLNRNVLVLSIAMFFLALSSVYVNRAVAENGFWDATFWFMFLMPFMLLPTFPLFKKDIKKVKVKQIGALTLVSIAGVIGTIAANAAYAINVGITSVILSVPLSMVIVFMLASFWPKLLEKHTIKVYAVRLLAAAVMIISALKLSA